MGLPVLRAPWRRIMGTPVLAVNALEEGFLAILQKDRGLAVNLADVTGALSFVCGCKDRGPYRCGRTPVRRDR